MRIVLGWIAVVFAAFGADGPHYFVSPGGADTNAGTQIAPFRTLERARVALGGRGGVVEVRGGDYVLTRTLALGPKDGGTAQTPAVYRAREGERVRLLGGRLVRKWTKVRDRAVLDRLGPQARRNVVACDLAALGVTNLGAFRSRGFSRPAVPAHLELFFGGKRMTVARWPNAGQWTKIAAPGDAAPVDDEHGRFIGRLPEGFHYEGDRPKQWRDLGDIWVHGYWSWDWANSFEHVAALDREKRLVKTDPPYGLYGFRKGQRFFFLNVLEELDEPGEYFVDRERKMLYFWPPSDVRKAEAAVSELETTAIAIDGARHVTMKGLSVEFVRGHGITITNAEDVRIEGATLANIGDAAVIVDGGARNAVADCDIFNTGDGGVEVTGGDRATLTAAGHAVRNNHIHHMGEWSRCYQAGIRVAGVGQRIEHNLIHDGPHTGILLTGNDHVIEYNELHHLALETGDVGAFYMGRDYTERGVVVRYNYFHHVGGMGDIGSMGVYLDDCASGATVVGNIFYQMKRAIFLGGGRDHRVENNVLIDCEPSVDIDGRGLDPKPVWHNMVYKTMKERLDAMKPDDPPYRDRYPELRELKKYYASDKGVPPEGNRVVRNVVQARGKPLEQWLRIRWQATPEMIEVKDNYAAEDVGFVDGEKGRWQLRDNSPVWKTGFQRIPVEKIGLQRPAR